MADKKFSCTIEEFDKGQAALAAKLDRRDAERNSEECLFKVGQRVYLRGANPLHIHATVTETMGDFVFVYWGNDQLTIVKEPCARLSAAPTPSNPV